MPAPETEYVQKPRGYWMRRYPKRDKTISARQWRKQVKAMRRLMKGQL